MLNIKNIINKITFIITVLALFFISVSENTINAKEKDLATSNELISLNYHRVRKENFIEKTLNIISVNKELDVYSVSTDTFESQILYLKNKGANFLTLDEVIEGIENNSFPAKSVWINFDDMDISIYKNAQPILEKYQVPATGFVITGQIGANNFNNLQLMNETELQSLSNSGLWDFASHTNDLHYLYSNGQTALVTAEPDIIANDIQKGQEKLKDLFGKNYPVIAYPYGISNDKVQDILEKNGIQYGFTLEDKLISSKEYNPYYLPRILVTEDAFQRYVNTWEDFKNDK